MPLKGVPRLEYSLAIVNGASSLDVLRNAGCVVERAIVKSAKARYRPMPAALPPTPVVVGLLLSKEPVPHRVLRWIAALLENPRVERVVIRPHPANLWKSLATTASQFPADRVRVAGSHEQGFANLDLVVCGNSSVHVDALVEGVPSVKAAGLDHTPDDALPFADDGLLFAANDADYLDLDVVMRHYTQPEWPALLRHHTNIDDDAADVATAIRCALRDLLERSPR
jgi:hypothetical protein